MTNETNEIKKDDLSESTVLTIDNTTTSSVDKLKEIIDFKIEKDQMYNTDKIYGKTYAFFYRNGDPLFVIGPHWPFYIGLSGTISVIGYFFFFYLWMILNTIIAYMGVFIFGFFFLSYTVTVLINPGVPSRKYSIINLNQAKIKNQKICTICQIYMDEEKMVSHCYECMVCIEGFDHHCPWTSKCVGRNNLLFFYCFVISIFVVFFYIMFAVFTLGIFV